MLNPLPYVELQFSFQLEHIYPSAGQLGNNNLYEISEKLTTETGGFTLNTFSLETVHCFLMSDGRSDVECYRCMDHGTRRTIHCKKLTS